MTGPIKTEVAYKFEINTVYCRNRYKKLIKYFPELFHTAKPINSLETGPYQEFHVSQPNFQRQLSIEEHNTHIWSLELTMSEEVTEEQ